MIRETRFLISRKPYAVDLTSLRSDEDGFTYIDAVWFRRKTRGYGSSKQTVTVACIGNLHTIQRPVPVDAVEFLTRYTDGRYGGDCHGRWDGTGYWGAEEPDVVEQHLAILRPMLANYPALPDGYDGWWTFQKPADRPEDI